MRPPEQVKRELVGQWLVRAEADLAVAERLLPEGPCHTASETRPNVVL